MKLDIEYAQAPLGHKIHGVDVAHLDDDQFRQIEDLWNRHGVVVIAGQKLSPDEHIAFTRRFGDLEKFVIDAYNLPGKPEIFVVSNIIENGKPIGMADAGRMWHSDMCFTPVPPRGSFLYALEVPMLNGQPLGDTYFASTAAAYDALPEATRRRIDGLRAVNSFSARVAVAAERAEKAGNVDPATIAHMKAERDKTKAEVPDVEHPLVRTHPITGRKCLYVSDLITSDIVGMPAEEGRALLKTLLEHVTRPQFVYRHRWQVGDLVMWDNCSSMHQAVGDFQLPLRRRMHRTTLKGTPPF
ncbi:TauD/TfdA family dioxygenase [Pigmentiphaga soli]|uniref:TauD/TfdA family dioxygenase n=1 Tax=Pigmentiphaga soli TaxID=1007095 RepID=A0ABP8GGY1_9BURK